GKAVQLGLKPIVVINKIDKPNCKPDNVQQDIFDLMYNLDGSDDQLEFETVFGSSKEGWMSLDWKNKTDNIRVLLDTILTEIPEAPYHEGSPQMQIASLDYSSYVGRIAIGRVFRGELKAGNDYTLCKRNDIRKRVRIKELYEFVGLGREEAGMIRSGDICAIIGLEDFEIGDTVADAEIPEPLPRISVDEPTMSMLFTINTSPFFGKEGKYVTSRRLRDRLFKETEKNLALKVEETGYEDRFNVFGRGLLHLSILVETMRREGYEFQIGKPEVIFKDVDGVRNEPFETLVIEVPEKFSGKAIELVTGVRGDLLVMEPRGDLLHLEFDVPARGLIGLRNNILTATAGEATMTHRFRGYGLYKGSIGVERNGSLIAFDAGQVSAYALDRLQDRGRFFVEPGSQVYKGQVVGENSRAGDLEVNVTKGKKLTNMRASGSDENLKIVPAVKFSLEEAMEHIKEDEYLEVTPLNLRMRKISF
ncbi:MAG: EF-Tu/IF-2/RF-3 family GTPase, partial [Bacteroidales bacterium]